MKCAKCPELAHILSSIQHNPNRDTRIWVYSDLRASSPFMRDDTLVVPYLLYGSPAAPNPECTPYAGTSARRVAVKVPFG